MQKKFIDIQQIIKSKNPNLLKWLPGFIVKYLERILHQDDINAFLNANEGKKNHEFCQAVVEYFNIQLEFEGLENIPEQGGATLAMNHPLGGMDAMALVAALKDKRPDLKFIVNDILLQLEPLKELFVGVNKHGKNNEGTYQKIDTLFNSGQLVCVFPAGLVSRKIDGKVRDLDWKKTFVTLSKRNNLPIIPIFIDGKLSDFFYKVHKIRSSLGIKANIEMLYLANELYKQKNVKIKFVVGKPILPESLDTKHNFNEWAKIIREKVYQLEN